METLYYENCKHHRIKSDCKECKRYCSHQKRKYLCLDCNPNNICVHKKFKSHCEECDGSKLCEHKKQKSNCKICHPVRLCKHKIDKRYCRECCGKGICDLLYTKSHNYKSHYVSNIFFYTLYHLL